MFAVTACMSTKITFTH